MRTFIKNYPLLLIALIGELMVALTCHSISDGFQFFGFAVTADAFVIGIGKWITDETR